MCLLDYSNAAIPTARTSIRRHSRNLLVNEYHLLNYIPRNVTLFNINLPFDIALWKFDAKIRM